MILRKIKLVNYRNYRRIGIKLHPAVNLFIGNNAQGKTNLLESVYFLALTKSHRAGIDQDFIRFGTEKAIIEGTVEDGDILRDLRIEILPEERKLQVNHTEMRRVADYISNLNVIIFTPDDLDIMKGSPNIRRGLLNVQISQLSKEYLTALNEYNKILKMRNEYLKVLYTSHIADERYLEVVTSKLIEKAICIYQYRKCYLERVNEEIGKIFSLITGEDNLVVHYEPNIELENYTEEEIRRVLGKKLKRNYQRELAQGMTLYGPHRDDFAYYLKEKSLKVYGSQGQQRLAVICHKLSEIKIFEEDTGSRPVLLLDDVFSEIDRKKRNRLLKLLNDGIQCIITTTDLKDIDRRVLKNYKVFNVTNGEITEKEG